MAYRTEVIHHPTIIIAKMHHIGKDDDHRKARIMKGGQGQLSYNYHVHARTCMHMCVCS